VLDTRLWVSGLVSDLRLTFYLLPGLRTGMSVGRIVMVPITERIGYRSAGLV
jgi:hypothetical protein